MKNIHKLYEKHLAELGVKTPTHNIIQYNNIVQVCWGSYFENSLFLQTQLFSKEEKTKKCIKY